ncbi:hypothetical protein L6R53_10095 [Myxococcota bacterium]|nr:hypothetical protein [Myxococcota bacterium]
MAQFGDFIARLFGGGTRGLSGDADRVLLDDPELEYFNARLRRHVAGDDLVEDPSAIWRGDGEARSGLKGHLESSEYTDGVGFTDVLVILSSDDWHNSLEQLREPWSQRAGQALSALLWGHCEAHDLHQVFPQRPFGFRFIEDGGHEMGGARIGLEPGQFVTGLLPNMYTGAVAASRPVISVLLNIPGQWNGYQEVGRLYSDQVQFTLGTHWLDNFSHPALRAPALYRLQQYADGSFVHIVNPDGKERFRISSHETPEGPAVLTLSGASGAPIAHMVLAIVEETVAPAAQPAAPAPAASAAPVVDAAPQPRIKAPPPPAVPAPSPTPPIEPRSDALSASRTLNHGGNRTVIPADVDERILTLRETGALFQKIHFNKFMDGYDVYLGLSGEVGTTIKDRAATFEIRGTTMALVPHVDDLRVDGLAVGPGKRMNLKGRVEIQVAGQRLEFHDLRMIEAEGWPYLGELRRPGGASHMVFGGTYKLGRDRRCKVRLPDEPNNTNIVWRPEMVHGGTIRSRNGEIPKSRFYTDSIMVASEHAELNLDGEPVLRSTARHCYTFIRRGGDVFSLAPAQGRGGPLDMDLQAGDEILIGNCVFAVDYPPADGPRMLPSDPPSLAPRISAQELAAASVSYEDLSAAGGPASGADLPAAAGLGEAGRAPQRPALTRAGPDSFLGVEPAPSPRARQTAAGVQLAGGPLPPLPPADDPPTEEQPRPSAPPAAGTPTPAASPADVPDPRVAPPLPSFKTLDSSGADDSLDSLDLRGPPAAAPAPPAPPPTPPSRPGEVSVHLDTLPLPEDSIPAPLLPATGADGVVEVDENQWQLELSRPATFCLQGFMITGEVTIGNHRGAAVVVPENRSAPGQQFQPRDYFRVFVRGRRGTIDRLDAEDAALVTAGGPVERTEELAGVRMEVVRRAPDGQEDFRVGLALEQPRGLPDPRAQLLVLADPDPMAEALFTRGLPLRRDHALVLGALHSRAHFDGAGVTLSDYLASYRRADGSLRPVFVQQQGQAWRTLPEDGSAVVLRPGDRLLVEVALYELR